MSRRLTCFLAIATVPSREECELRREALPSPPVLAENSIRPAIAFFALRGIES